MEEKKEKQLYGVNFEVHGLFTGPQGNTVFDLNSLKKLA